MYSIMTVVNNSVVYLKVAKRVDLKSSHHKERQLCEVIDVSTNLIVVIISQYIHISNHTLTQCSMSIISQ